MITTSSQEHSESNLMAQLIRLSDAGASVIQIRTREPMRAALTLRKHMLGADTPYREWDVVNGFRAFTKENYPDHNVQGDKKDFIAALDEPLESLRDPGSSLRSVTDKVHFFTYVDPHLFMRDNPYASELIQQYSAILPTTNVCLLLITSDEPLPGVAIGDVLVADFSTPSADELREVAERLIENALSDDKNFKGGSELDEDDINRIAHLGLGLSLYEFETYTALTLVEAAKAKPPAHTVTLEMMLEGIGRGKTAVIRQSEILELTHATSISDVGGMHRLKDWVAQRANSYSDEARAFGVEPPKGAALVGVPGTGKSLVAKAIAGVFGVPLVRMDFARIFSKYVGDSESRVRSALKMVESMAPCVLFVDEIDKGLGGSGGGGDSGTSSRVLGSFLTWLQECKAPVFTMVTMNRVDGLPPELLRKGRFDAIFSVGMPNDASRREVLGIHLGKRGRNIADFDDSDIAAFIAASKDYVPAEIEAVVKDAITAAFNDAGKVKKLTMGHILQALKETVPMSKSHAASIARITEWASANATPVEYTDSMPDPRAVKVKQTAPTKSLGRVMRAR